MPEETDPDPGGGVTLPGEEEDTSEASSPDADAGLPNDTIERHDTGSDADGSDNGSDGGDVSAGDCGGMTCADGKVCRDDQCEPLAEVTCREAADQGTLSAGSTLTIEGSFDGSASDGLSTGCAGSEQAPERVYSFELDESSLIDVTTDWKGSFDAKVEFRRGDCLEVDADKRSCLDSDRTVWAAGGETVYLVVENDRGEGGEFTVDLEAQAAVCRPDTFECSGSDSVDYCRYSDGMVSQTTLDCPGSCSMGECAGRSCSNPVDVSGTKTYTGTTDAFEATMDFKQASNCVAGSPQPPSAGSEVVFRVSMTQGETLSIDTSADEANNLIFITSDCKIDPTQMDCLEATDEEAVTEWTAPSSGRFYVIIDKATLSSRSFEYAFDIK
jgi:hypothetical protein